MNCDFPRILTLLRKERGISQKEAAGSLGISQALLSHYEKGIRECGLDFLVRVSDFYGVSTDYLLGRSPHRPGLSALEEGTIPGESPGSQRQAIFHSVQLLFELLRACGNRGLLRDASRYLMLALYQLFHILHQANPQNPPGLFSLSPALGCQYAQGVMHLCEGRLNAVCRGERGQGLEPIADMDTLLLSADSLAAEYPQHAPALLQLIRQAEEQLALCSTGAEEP